MGQLLHRLDEIARGLIPVVVALALVTLSVAPLNLPELAPVSPAWALMCVHYWTLRRPDLFGAPAVFVVGLYADVLTGAPLGVSAFTLLLVHGVLSTQRRSLVERSFLVSWWAFMIVAAVATLVEWAAVSLLAGALLNPVPSLFQYLLTILLFPPLAWALALVERAVPGERPA